MEIRRPLHPDNLLKVRISDYVIDVVNRLIRRNWDGREAIFAYNDILAEIKKDGEESNVTPDDVKPENIHYVYLNTGGWYVTYHEPNTIDKKAMFVFKNHY